MAPAQELKAKLRADLLAARKAGQADDVPVLRSLLAAIDNAEAPAMGSGGGASEIDRLVLTEAQLVEVLRRDLDERETAAAQLAGVGQHERAEALIRQAEIVRRYLA